MALAATREASYTLVDLIDRILDKGLVINADISISLVGVELLGIKIRASLSSLETAAKYGLELPGGTNVETSSWKEARLPKEKCPQCEKIVPRDELLDVGCPWCGWKSARARMKSKGIDEAGLSLSDGKKKMGTRIQSRDAAPGRPALGRWPDENESGTGGDP
jgi:predicted RNA-binding Zn-ribbon protein involved in translation (DUF1610 family)